MLQLPTLNREPGGELAIQALASGVRVRASRLGGDIALLKPGHPASWTSGLQVVRDDQVDRSSGWFRRIYDERLSEQIALRLLQGPYATARDAGL
jgi:hypothetical protein